MLVGIPIALEKPALQEVGRERGAGVSIRLGERRRIGELQQQGGDLGEREIAPLQRLCDDCESLALRYSVDRQTVTGAELAVEIADRPDGPGAAANFGTIAQGQVVLANVFNSTIASSIDTLDASGTGVSTFTTLPAGVNANGIGFAPASFGAFAGDLFASDLGSGKLFVINAAGNSTLFATLPLPTGFSEPGLRQIAWAPADFGAYGGDLFVSIAAQNGGGGSDGEIDILNAAGQTVGHYAEGTGAAPLDPRGLFFVNDTTLLVANADPGIQLLTPSDFVAGSPAVPEPRPGRCWRSASRDWAWRAAGDGRFVGTTVAQFGN
jgi:hypothetical protein